MKVLNYYPSFITCIIVYINERKAKIYLNYTYLLQSKIMLYVLK
jgi:hypothetical protein